ncbi:guanitoxin biosynthesis heme-dependent pre-guanitoxin N-hydroxylase GntA [Qipengyuania sp. G39]|uniref:Guanitoxin biosynthesis heme-dependent pre-guanitoxin N-hydroxylase GntA n=1 Tax=Qipengyuania profundimaris TaxID=3067652 RepID=A0ABT9HM66_9SPHN|nr:guanitoxin biosynthesis heme-dependent pre-guanitoxin N-hydroxylase GntA [Qipengyuania sp. G39]MDP4574241.1 guanitoxin biosynthesis heme-dependent pre-guanitoxin N-hydroxylase GntA [Qipengyuania sp. G39]
MKPGMLGVEDRLATRLADEFREHIRRAAFPCVGAKSALAKNSLEIVIAFDMCSGWDDLRIHDKLIDWAETYRDDPEGLRSIAVIFAQPVRLDENDFERLLWERLQSFADKDNWLGQPYDPGVSPDPGDPHFSLSFGGQAYFVVGLHPAASRPARRFSHPAMVFNLHDQFERLRAEGKYERMRASILERDRQLAGDVNPMLARHGESSEARQYSGRRVDDDWECPFRDPRSERK